MLLMHIIIIVLRHILYLVHLCPCLGLVLFMPYLCDLFFIFSFLFIIINHIISLKQRHLFFAHFLEYLILVLDHNMDEEREDFSNIKSSASGFFLSFCLIFCQIEPGVASRNVAYGKTEPFSRKIS